jgi:predicted PurR-regulated permease PerM
VPLVVSSKVKINAFVSLVSIITGGAIGGVAGMFLAIPLIAVIKVVFDRIDFLEPWGFVMGDNLPKNNKVVKIKIPFWGKKTK